MTNQYASAILALAFAAALIVAGQLYIEKSSTSMGRVIAATMPARACSRKRHGIHPTCFEKLTRPVAW